MKIIWSLITFCLCCAASGALAGEGTYASRGCPDTIQNFQECDRFIEAALIRQHPRLFHRQNDRLRVRLTNGRTRLFKDTYYAENVPWDAARGYSMIKYFPELDFCLISIVFFEGRSTHLLDLKTGKELVIGGDVLLSADRKRFVAFGDDIEAGYSPNFIAVYRLLGRRLVEEFKISPEDWAPIDVKWLDSAAVTFRQKRWAKDGAGFESSPALLRMTTRNGKLEWSMVPH